ncbi:MAG TPA: tetratricopeptide repeat protein [Rhizomicrobium sp.]|nr:tetratricopeptide repeat protein [Rhizomicrobium sp.]
MVRRIGSILLLAALAACSTANKPAAPVVPAVTVSDADRLDHAVALLQQGNTKDAEVELHTLLTQDPDNKQAQFLMAQIETPVTGLFPAKSFSLKLAKDDSLTAVARTYLGNPLAFYGLARFNNIAVPQSVTRGQTIRIPKTPDALAALARRNAPAPVAQASTDAPVPVAVPVKPSPAAQHKLAQEFYRRGVVAFQHQDLEAAIGLWDKCLAIEPDNSEAQLNRAQAIHLKDNLAKLRQEKTIAAH